MTPSWTGGQYSVFRGLFGAYLLIHFAGLLPYGTEVFSSAGVLPDAAMSPLARAFPNILVLVDAPWAVAAVLVLAAVASIAFAMGLHDRAASILLWYIWACLFGRNPLIGNPGLPYVGWMLLAHAFLPPRPEGAWSSRGRADPGWRMPRGIYMAAWILMALGYSYSGYTKLVSPSWLDGTAVQRVLESPLARPTVLREALLTTPAWALRGVTWAALGLELGFAPLALFPPLRPLLWGAMFGLHLTLIVLIDFADLSLGMVMLHLFTLDPAWVRRAIDRAISSRSSSAQRAV